MWLDFFWRWRYGLLRRRIPDIRQDPMGAISGLNGLFCRLRIEPHTYRTRVQQRIACKSETISDLMVLLQRVNGLVNIETKYTDSLFARYFQRQTHNLDEWLIDANGYPVDEPQAQQLIGEQVHRLITQLNTIHAKNEVLYQYYNHNLYYVLTDAYYAMDALMALQLRIHPQQRIAALPLML